VGVINVESTSEGVPRLGLRVALGAVILAVGWLVAGAVSGGDSASAADIPPLAPDALSAAISAPTAGLAGATATVTGAATATVHAAPAAADGLLATLAAVAAVAGQTPVQDVAAPVVRVASAALDRVADAVDLTAVEHLLPALPDVLVPGAAPAGITLAAEIGGAALPTAAGPSLGSAPSSASHASAQPPTSGAIVGAASEPMPPPGQPSAPASPADAVMPTAAAGHAVECDLTRAPWAMLASGSALLSSRNDDLPRPPASDFDPTPD
jgi:hypothetical protein